MNVKALIAASVLVIAMAFAPAVRAQITVTEEFTNAASNNPWFFFNGACLTAGSATSLASPGPIPGCAANMPYYSGAGDTYLVGGSLGYLGSSTAGLTPDAVGSGALRFTNGSVGNGSGGYQYGFSERGAIVSAGPPFATGSGVQITFKTVTYLGNKGGTGDGADGISFYLLDGCMPITGGNNSTLPGSGVPAQCTTINPIYGTGQTFAAIGATGGSLAYSCSNNNAPYDGLVGAYLGVGIDEYGNFLNGNANTLNETGSTGGAPGDNTATGGFYQPGRIGLRGAGSVSWQALNTAYGTFTSSSAPYYPSTLSSTCATGTTYSGGSCLSCPTGSGGLSGGQCLVCSSGAVYYSGNGKCGSCPARGRGGAGTFSNGVCSNGATPSYASTTTQAPTSAGTSDQRLAAVHQTCQTGLLYNYADHSGTGVSVGAASLQNAVNTAGILDYAAIGSTTNGSAQGYSVLTQQIANETATTRAAATPIAYSLKITQDGYLSLSYSYNGGTAVPVITNENISSTNGTPPALLRFGFAGSTGGSSNVHEILCFKASPVQTGNGSGGVNVFQDPTLKSGAELFLASYFPSDWTGSVTATPILFDTTKNVLTLATTPTWDGACVLTGGACATTGAATGTAEAPASRVMLTWNGSQGVPFEWSSLTTAEQGVLDYGDSTPLNANRANYLRGDRTNEVNSAGVGLFRARDSVLADVIDSSPSWVGPPGEPYVSLKSWVDGIYPTATPPENSGSQTYLQYQQAKQGRLNVVYVGANDGFLHGFRAGTLDANGNLISTVAAPNDGYEVLAYMPGYVLGTIHPTTVNGSGTTIVNTSGDYANTQYSHAYFVDATPATGDLFYGGVWHTWLVGGLGEGGPAIYALDVTDPSLFTETNANTIVMGEWSSANLTCSGATASCGQYLGKTYGTPEIRRFHNGDWGVIFGNGYGDLDSKGNPGAAGVYVMLIDSSSGAKTFYYLQATASASGALPNGIASPTSLDVDLDHVIDYIYAGDLLGNVWKFDVTSQSPANWGKTASSPLFTAPYTPAVAASGTTPAIPAAPSPISTRLQVGTLKTIGTTVNGLGTTISNSPERIIINFGTGRAIPQTPTNAASYASGPQYLYGIWDWDFGTKTTLGTWNALSPNQQALSLTAPQTISPPGSSTNLQVQTISTATIGSGATAQSVRTMSKTPVCWVSDSACGGGASQNKMGWYIQLPGVAEQVIFDPTYSPEGEFVVNTYVPAANTPLSCNVVRATGFSMGLDPLTGGGSPTPFFNVGGVSYDGVQLNGTGTPSFLSSGQAADHNAEYLLTQTTAGTPAAPQQVNRDAVVTGQTLNWIQRR